MDKYYNANDLLIRRINTQQWLCCQSDCVVNSILYGEIMPADTLMNLELVVAYLEASGCYTPITTEEEDGVINCLTEAQLTSIFENISTITGLQWHGIGITYRDEPTATDEGDQIGTFTLSTGQINITIKD